MEFLRCLITSIPLSDPETDFATVVHYLLVTPTVTVMGNITAVLTKY